MWYMPPLHIQDTNHELNTPYLHMKSTIKSLNNFHPKHVSQRYCIKQTKTNAQDRIHNKEKKLQGSS